MDKTKGFFISDIYIRLDFNDLSFLRRNGLYSHFSQKFIFENDTFSNKCIILKYHKRRRNIEELASIFEKYGNTWVKTSGEKFFIIFELSKKYLYVECELNLLDKTLDIFFDYDAINYYKYVDSLSLTAVDYYLLNPLFLSYNSLIFHSSAVSLNGKGYLFLGHSTYGKSTICNLLKNNIPEAEALSDDRNLISLRDSNLIVSSFWREINDLREFKSFSSPISKIFFIKKSQKNQAIKIDNSLAKTRLFNFFFRLGGENINFINDSTKLIFNFSSVFDNFYDLEFTKELDFVDYFKNTIINSEEG